MRPRAPTTSAGFAAILSGLFPGLGQLYQGRWIRGLLMILVPAFALALVGALVLIADPITAFAVRHASLLALLVVGGLFAYHVVVVADAFVGHARGLGELRARRAGDHAMVIGVALVLALLYTTVYRESAAWATLLARVFDPVASVLPVDRGSRAAPAWTGSDRLNVLLLGIDRRPEASETENTDTIIVASLDPLNHTASMLSIPRDTLVAIPGHGQDKVNAAYSYGGKDRGADLVRETVEDLLGIQIHSYAIIDFEAFTRMVDSFGGVIVDVKRPLRDEEYPTADFGVERISLMPGPQLMNGEVALRYARSRHDSNDFSRARRQQEVIAALRLRLQQVGIGRLPAISDQVGSSIQTNFDPANLLPLARTGVSLESSAIRSEVLLPCDIDVPHCELNEQNDGRGYYLIPDRTKLRNLVAEVFYDPHVRQESARVEVRATGARGDAAREVADRLEARAFRIAKRGDGTSASSAVVLRNAAKRYTAERLAEQLGLQVKTDPSESGDADIVVKVGADFRGFASDRG